MEHQNRCTDLRHLELLAACCPYSSIHGKLVVQHPSETKKIGKLPPLRSFGFLTLRAEELVAEMTVAFLCAHLDLKGELRHASYINNWIELLKEDSGSIFTAASLASKAATICEASANHPKTGWANCLERKRFQTRPREDAGFFFTDQF